MRLPNANEIIGASLQDVAAGGLPVEQVNGSTALWLHHDQLGSTRLVTNGSGTNQATYTFDAYGKLTASTGTITNPLRFAGEYNDSESGLYYLRARFYDTSSGQFISRDPVIAATREPYAYAGDSPLDATDPRGLACLAFWDPSQCDNPATPAFRSATTPTTLPNDRAITGPINVMYGGYKVLSGIAAFAAGTVVEVTVPVVGLTVGIPAQLYGSYQVVTGVGRFYRGAEQMDSARSQPTVCKSPIQWAVDLGLDLAPGGGGVTNLLGGLP